MTFKQITVHRGRTAVLPVSVGIDVSLDTITSEIREKELSTSEVIAEWDVSFATDGIDGELIFTIDDSITADIENSIGYMDAKRVVDGQPVNLFDELIEVVFRDVITE